MAANPFPISKMMPEEQDSILDDMDITAKVKKIAHTPYPVLIRGETGTGKEVMARYIHRESGLKGPFVSANLACIPPMLVESELFGHEKGAFTGAVKAKPSFFEEAKNGTVFLDEIGEVSNGVATALLRVLQEHEITRVGGTRTIRVNARIIAATNRDLPKAVAEKNFRIDLYHRLSTLEIVLPTLKERMTRDPTVLRRLGDLMMRKHAGNEPPKRLSDEAIELLSRHEWPGNIREFENTCVGAIIESSEQTIGAEDLRHIIKTQKKESGVPNPISKRQILEGVRNHGGIHRLVTHIEELAVLEAMYQTDGDRVRAAKMLGMSMRRFEQVFESAAEKRQGRSLYRDEG